MQTERHNMAKNFMVLPENLGLPQIHDRAVEVARSLSGLRVSDAVSILENAQLYVMRAGIAATELIPPRNDEPQTGT